MHFSERVQWLPTAAFCENLCDPEVVHWLACVEPGRWMVGAALCREHCSLDVAHSLLHAGPTEPVRCLERGH